MTTWSSQHEYLRAEWDQFFEHPELGQRTLDAVGPARVVLALDIGCGAGQELVPFVTAKGAVGIGVDIRFESLQVARSLLASVDLADRVELLCARAEALPFRPGWFDAVVCRGVLAYTDIRATLIEVRRMLRPGAVVILQVNTLRRDLDFLPRRLRARNWRAVREIVRRIAAGCLYRARGRQPTNRWTGSEVFFTRRHLRTELARVGMTIVADVPHGNLRVVAVVATTQS